MIVLSTCKVSKENQLSKLKHVRGQWQDSINDEDTEAQSGVSNVPKFLIKTLEDIDKYYAP